MIVLLIIINCMPSIKKFRFQPGHSRPTITDLQQWIKSQPQSRKQITKQLAELATCMQAEGKQSLLIIFQALDAAGKDSTIAKVFRYCDPNGLTTTAFKTPSKLETQHDFMWRCYPHFPAAGRISLFNRSYYEETLIVRVHPRFLIQQGVEKKVNEKFWQQRFDYINQVEAHLHHNGTQVVKFMLDVSKEEQQNRLIKRYAMSDKNWKFNIGDLKERRFWDDYQDCFDAMLEHSSTKNAPWYVIPADDKEMMRILVATIVQKRMQKMACQYPDLEPLSESDLALLDETIHAQPNNH